MSAPHRKVVNFTLKMETFVTCLIWDGGGGGGANTKVP